MPHLSMYKILSFARTALVVLTALVFVGCQSSTSSRDDVDPVSATPDSGTPVATNPSTPAATNPATPVPTTPVVPDGASEDGSNGASNGEVANRSQYRIELSGTQFNIEEGLTTANVNINIVRENGHNTPISLALEGSDRAALANTDWRFSDLEIGTNESTSNLQIELAVARGPIQPQQRLVTLVATDANLLRVESVITLNIQPTSAMDVYLLIGQSNMVGASEFNARESDVGEADAPNGRIFQLNVIGNDTTNFTTAAAFTSPDNFVNQNSPRVVALDPLHDGFNFSIDGKTNTQIGMGLSFAKAMLQSTRSEIMLVPAAWSDTGFCLTDTTIDLPGLGWNATPPEDTTNFAGTLLHDRAIARLNFTLEQTGGVFRGILWHQGEADSSERRNCAAQYEENLERLVASIRTNAAQDIRGPLARGAAADVPFIAGTLSFGGEFAAPSPARALVDNVHRGIPSNARIPFAALVINDDLVPENGFPCGNGGCIHFGSLAYREMGRRYAQQMQSVQRR